MALAISQIVAASYPAVLGSMRKAENQWAESALMRELEKQGAVERKAFGPTLEAQLDYQRNQAAGFRATELETTSLAKTEFATAASFTPAELSSPIVWSMKDEVENPSDNQKIDLAKARMENAINTHDDLVEQALFTTSTNGFLGLLTHVPTSGQGTDGGINSALDVFWRNQQSTYVDETDIEAALTSCWNACAKGSGSKLMPTFMVSDGPTQAIFEGTQQALQRYGGDEDLKAGFKVLYFKNTRYVFSQYGTSSIFLLNPKSFNLVAARGYFRKLDEAQKIQNANGYVANIYSALQTVTNNKSRLGVVHI